MVYDPTTGRFSSLDPFAGDANDPQSFHKYAYVHGDPINHVDPTGKFIGLISFGAGFAGSAFLRARHAGFKLGALGYIITTGVGVIGGLGALIGSSAIAGLIYDYDPIWQNGLRPDHDDQSTNQLWIDNVSAALKRVVESRQNITPQQRQAGIDAADDIAKIYVESVRQRGVDLFGLQESGNANFGYGGLTGGWAGNFNNRVFDGVPANSPDSRNCAGWTSHIDGTCRNDLRPFEAAGWYFRSHRDTQKLGDPLFAIFSSHNFTSLTFDPNHVPRAGTNGSRDPDIVFDPWIYARPDVFDFDDVNRLWPIDSGTSSTY